MLIQIRVENYASKHSGIKLSDTTVSQATTTRRDRLSMIESRINFVMFNKSLLIYSFILVDVSIQ